MRADAVQADWVEGLFKPGAPAWICALGGLRGLGDNETMMMMMVMAVRGWEKSEKI